MKRVAISREPDTTVLALGGKPGEPYTVSAWEAMFAAMPAARRGDWDEAIRLHHEALAERPDHPALLYNLACMEARAGRSVDALAHLRRAGRARAEVGGLRANRHRLRLDPPRAGVSRYDAAGPS